MLLLLLLLLLRLLLAMLATSLGPADPEAIEDVPRVRAHCEVL